MHMSPMTAWSVINVVLLQIQGISALKQWVSQVIDFSSESLDSPRSAQQIIGSMDGGFSWGQPTNVWCQRTIDEYQFIEIKVDTPVRITGIEVYEMKNPGGLKRISAMAPNSEWDTLYEVSAVTVMGGYRVFTPELLSIPYYTDTFRLDVDCTAAGAPVAIDCVRIIGSSAPAAPDTTTDSPRTISSPVVPTMTTQDGLEQSRGLHKRLNPLPHRTVCKPRKYSNDSEDSNNVDVNEPKIEKRNTSRYRRTKISTQDNRISCAAFGGIFLITVTTLIVLLVISDTNFILRKIRKHSRQSNNIIKKKSTKSKRSPNARR